MLAEQSARPSRWWRWRAPPADGRRAHSRSPAPAPRQAAWCRSRAAAASRFRTCRERRRRAGRCRAPCRGPRCGNARWWRRPAPVPGRRSPPVGRLPHIVEMTGTSPPGPLRCGSTTCSVNAVATPASKALPPFSSIAMPTAVAIQWVEVTTPNVPSISGRVVKGLGLILLMNPVSRATFRLRTYSTVLRFAGPDEVRPKCGRAHLPNSESAPPVRRRQEWRTDHGGIFVRTLPPVRLRVLRQAGSVARPTTAEISLIFQANSFATRSPPKTANH